MQHPFDWAAWDAQFDRQQLAVTASIARWNEAEREVAQARLDMARDVRVLIEDVVK